MAYIELADLGQASAEFGGPPAVSPGHPYFEALSKAPAPGAISPAAVDAAGKAEADALLAAFAELGTVATQAQKGAAQAASVLQPKRAKLIELRRTLAGLKAAPGMGDLGNGAMKFVFGQLMKIDADVRSGRWTDMLVELARITPEAGGKEVQDLLKDPVLSAIRKNLETNYKPQDPALLEIARTALSSMASRPPLAWDGQTPAPPPPLIPPPGQQDNAALLSSARNAAFDPAVYEQNSQGFSRYIATHKKAGGGVVKSVAKATGQVSGAVYKVPVVGNVAKTLDKYVPGWTIGLNFILPGGGLLGLLSTAVGVAGKVPLVGNVLSAASFVSGGAPAFTGGAFAGPSGLVTSTFGPVSGGTTGFGPTANLSWAVENTPLKLVNSFPISTAKVTNIYLTTHGNVLKKVAAASVEALSQIQAMFTAVALVAFAPGAPALAPLVAAMSAATAALKGSIIAAQSGDPYAAAQAAAAAASAVVGLGGVAGGVVAGSLPALLIDATQTALTGVKTGITVAQTVSLAKKAKKAGDVAVRDAAVEAAELDRQTAEIQTQIAQLKARQAETVTARRTAAAKREVPLAAPVARSLGVSQETVVYGGIALAVLAIGIVIVMSDEDED